MPSEAIFVAILSLLGTFVGTFSGMKIVMYRVEQLEKKVEKHNCIIERVYKLEGRADEATHEIEDLKKKVA